MNINHQTNVAQLMTVNGGTHTVFDAQVQIADVECIEKSVASKGAIPIESCNSFPPASRMITANHSAFMLGQLSLAGGNVRRFNLFWTARNGDWTQFLRLAKIDGKWRSAIRVFRGEEILFEEVESGVPREVLGPEWTDHPALQGKTA
jgi:hypothetical protein